MRRFLLFAVAGLLLLGGLALAGATPGSYRGKTKQGLAITVRTSAHGLKSATYQANYRCRRRNHTFAVTRQRTVLGPSARKANGTIDTRQVAAQNDRAHLVLGGSGRTLHGYLSESYVAKAGAACQTGRVRFTVKR